MSGAGGVELRIRVELSLDSLRGIGMMEGGRLR